MAHRKANKWASSAWVSTLFSREYELWGGKGNLHAGRVCAMIMRTYVLRFWVRLQWTIRPAVSTVSERHVSCT
jgi:hypothetical protein